MERSFSGCFLIFCGSLLLGGVAAHAAPALEVYGRLPSIEHVRLSPSGEHVALIGVAAEKRRLIVMTPAGQLESTGPVGDTKIRGIEWGGNDNLLIFKSNIFSAPLYFEQAYELGGAIRVGLHDKKVLTIFANSRSIENTVQGYYGYSEMGGKPMAFFGGITDTRTASNDYVFEHGFADLYRVDLVKGDATLVSRGNERGHHWVMSADGRVASHSDYDRKTGEWRLFAGGTGGELRLKRTSPTDDIALLGLGRSADSVVVADGSGDTDVMEEVSLTSGKVEPLFNDNSVEELLFDPSTRLLLGAKVLEEPRALFFDRNLQKRMNATYKAFPGLQVDLVSYVATLGRIIVKTEGDQDAGTFWLVDIATGNATPLGEQYPEVKSADVAPTSLFTYKAGDGTEIEAILTLPPGREPKALALVVMPHGGPIGIRDRLGFDWWAQALASRGYAVLQPNYRGSGGYGVAFREAGYGEWGRKMISDIAEGVAALAARQIIDPKRVAIAGASYGGYAALAGVTLQQGLYRCAVSVAGPANLQSFFHWQVTRYGLNSDSTRYWRKVTGADAGGENALRAQSPALLAAKADAPVLLIHGKDDTRVPLEQSEQMASALKKAGKPYEYVELEKEDHFLSRDVTRTTMLKAAVAFIEKYNPPDQM